MEKLFGGNPVAVIIRLLILSVIAGIVMSALNIRPDNIFYHLRLLAGRVYDLGFGVFDGLIQYLLIGAMVVIPLWIIARLLSALSGKSREPNSKE